MPHSLLWGSSLLGVPSSSVGASERMFSLCMKEFDILANYKGKKTLVTNITWWGDDYVLTGMHSKGRNVWRFTPSEESVTSTYEGIVNNSLVFKTSKARITIPQGVIYTGNGCSVRGYWIIQPDSAPKPHIENL
jgi:hypothetical protein